ncbi:hypothetical protein VB735_33375 [Halotia wernerae UHCC 0503]|nr:hypothetical protein [Halotia wernerae UHCC 0503]
MNQAFVLGVNQVTAITFAANSYLAPLRTSPGKVKRYAIKLLDFAGFLSQNQGFQLFTE